MSSKTTKYPLVLIRWVDSTLGFQGWKNVEDEPKELSVFVSVGFLVFKNKECTILCPHVKSDFRESDNIVGTGDIKIPNVSIKSVKVFKNAYVSVLLYVITL